MRTFVGLTGASGHHYSERLIQALVEAGHSVDLSITPSGCKVLRHERGIDGGVQGEKLAAALPDWLGAAIAAKVRVFVADAVEAPPSSGTSLTGGVILCPCSMGTLARVSVGFSSNLVERAADVALKEGRRLLIVPRETPLSEIHLENMLRLARLGAIVLPAMPGFYHGPKSINDLVDHVVGKILDRMEVVHDRGARWKGLAQATSEPDSEPGIDSPLPPSTPDQSELVRGEPVNIEDPTKPERGPAADTAR
ncbi:MAG: 4-hydroxy-3-polyprenylbenzoate decarboxylase [Planctomycetota bacterium]|jgi:4-hydroxy-3-polyprenylbenzoate decarboxylase